MPLDQIQKKKILKNVRARVLKNHFNVAGIDYNEWAARFDEQSGALIGGSVDEFESGVQSFLKELRSSHTGFYHERPSRLLPQHTIGATLGKFEDGNQRRWFVLDVFEKSPSHRAGIRPGDILQDVDGVAYVPPDMPPFKTGTTHTITFSAPYGGERKQLDLEVPKTKGSKDVPPILPPEPILTSMLRPGVGLLRVTWFPGAMGLGFSRSLDEALSRLKGDRCTSLVIDLRGNIGGGLGFARLASYFCPDQRPVGFSLTPKRLRTGYTPEDLDRVIYPSSRIGFATTLARYAGRDKSIFLVTQGLGSQPFHGKIAILVNEWTNSAAEMLTSFAAENKLATIVGNRTAGNVLGAVNTRVGGGYWLRVPVFGWYTNTGKCIEGSGVLPDLPVEVHPGEMRNGTDAQLETALNLFSS